MVHALVWLHQSFPISSGFVQISNSFFLNNQLNQHFFPPIHSTLYTVPLQIKENPPSQTNISLANAGLSNYNWEFTKHLKRVHKQIKSNLISPQKFQKNNSETIHSLDGSSAKIQCFQSEQNYKTYSQAKLRNFKMNYLSHELLRQ